MPACLLAGLILALHGLDFGDTNDVGSTEEKMNNDDDNNGNGSEFDVCDDDENVDGKN